MITTKRGRKELKLYTKICKRCHNPFGTTHKYSKVCSNCIILNPNWSKKK